MPDPSELSGWGAIATYLGVTERSAQEYEKKFGLPVHRMPGPRGRIWALRDEIDFWKRAQDGRSRNGPDPFESRPATRRPLFWIALASILAVSALAAKWWISQRRGPATNYTISGRTLTVYDDQKRVRWSHQFVHYPATYPPPIYPRVLFSDFDGDGRTQTLFVDYALSEGGIPIRAGQAELNDFDDTGRLKWTQVVGTPFFTTQRKPSPAAPYVVKVLGRLRTPRPDGGLIVVGASQGGSWAYEVEIYTATGRKVGTYLHPGWLWSMLITDLNQDGVEEIILGGVNNGFGERGYGATLVVLDSRRVEGQGRVPSGDTRQAAGLPTGVESAVLLMPDYVSNPEPHHYCRTIGISLAGDQLEVTVSDEAQRPMKVRYRLDRHLRLLSVQPDLQQELQLLAALPKPVTPQVREQYLMRKLGGIKVLRNDFASGQKSATVQ